MEIVQLFVNPPRDPAPAPEELVESIQDVTTSETLLTSTITDDSEAVPFVSSGGPSGSSSFHFMQASEIETHSFEESEWVEKPDVEALSQQAEVSITSVNGHTSPEGQPSVVTGEVIVLCCHQIRMAK